MQFLHLPFVSHSRGFFFHGKIEIQISGVQTGRISSNSQSGFSISLVHCLCRMWQQMRDQRVRRGWTDAGLSELRKVDVSDRSGKIPPSQILSLGCRHSFKKEEVSAIKRRGRAEKRSTRHKDGGSRGETLDNRVEISRSKTQRGLLNANVQRKLRCPQSQDVRVGQTISALRFHRQAMTVGSSSPLDR